MNKILERRRLGRTFAALTFVLSVTGSACADTGRWANVPVKFATREEGAQFLGATDEYISRMNPLDRSARMKTELDVSEDEFLQFVANEVMPWNEREQATVERAFSSITDALDRLNVPPLPEGIRIIKTTGKEEGNAAYTRGNAIILPAIVLDEGSQQLQWLISHELFHVISRRYPDLREALYRTIGFTRGHAVVLPPQLASRKIANPDTPIDNHFIRLRVGPTALCAIPTLLFDHEHYSKQRGGEFFDYLQFRLLVTRRPFKANGDLADVGLIELSNRVAGFFEQVGLNTDYIIHPEEILADNFALLVTKRNKPRSPQILERMTAVFAKFTPSEVPANELAIPANETCQL